MFKKVLLFITLLALCFSLFSVKVKAQVSCSGSELDGVLSAPSESSLDSIVSFGIFNAPDQFKDQTIYLQIKHPSGSGIHTETVKIDPAGNATVHFDPQSYNLSAGDYIYYFTSDYGLSGSDTPCSSTKQLSLTGNTCKSLGDDCSSGDTNFCNSDAICGSNGKVQIKQASTFTFVCTRKKPATCNRCENFSDGSQKCSPAGAEYAASCENTCNPENNSAANMAGTSGANNKGSSTGIPGNNITCDNSDGTAINTAIGCIPFGDPAALSAFFLRWAVGIGGGIAFLMMIYSGFIIMTSAGNPDRLKGGKELMTSAVMGLLMIIFSVFILRFVGIDLLGINFGG